MDPGRQEAEAPVPLNNENIGAPIPVPSLITMDLGPHAALSSASTIDTSTTESTERRLHVSNIPFKWREDDMLEVFSPFGETKQVAIVFNERGSKGYGFVTFLRAEDADRAQAALSGREFEGRKIEVNVATGRGSPYLNWNGETTDEKRLHISNIPFKWREDDLRAVFNHFGEMKHVEIVYNDRGSKGYGFITFLRAEDADRAKAEMFGQEFHGRKIEVLEATPIIRRHPKSVSISTMANWMLPNVQPLLQQQQLSLLQMSGGHNSNTNQYSNISTLLLQQKQLLMQQQLQQYLATQQQSDLIASALGLPTSNLNGLLAGNLQYPAAASAAQILPNIDPLMLQASSLLSVQQLQLLQQQALQPTVLPVTSQPAASMAVNALLPSASIATNAYTQFLPSVSDSLQLGSLQAAAALPLINEITPSTLRQLSNRSSTRDIKTDRFAPY